MAAIRPPYTATFNDYVRRALGYKTDAVYHILGGGIGAPWDFASPNGFADTSRRARAAPSPRTPTCGSSSRAATTTSRRRTSRRSTRSSHMGLDAEQRARISTGQYEAGHMMYIHEGELARLKQDVAKFIAGALAKPQ